MNAFQPSWGHTVSINVASSSANVQVSGFSDNEGAMRIYNEGTATAFINVGFDNTVAAALTNLPIAPGSVEVITLNVPNNASLYVAAIAAGATGKIYFTPGEGI